MKKALVNFKGLYGDDKMISVADFLHLEPIEQRSKQYNWEIDEHLHTDLIQVFIIETGEGLLISEHKKLTIEAPSVLIIPSNTLHGFVFQSDISGEVLTFSAFFLESIFKHSPNILLEINALKQYSFENQAEKFKALIYLKNKIEEELNFRQAERNYYLTNIFQLFFLDLYRLNLVVDNRPILSDNRTLVYYQTFQKNIKKSLHETKSIENYAKELTITAVHLNRICRKLVQKTALEVVKEHIINEAKKYLTNTTYSISEISYFLNFRDPAYFSRLFKKYTGSKPSDFRKI